MYYRHLSEVDRRLPKEGAQITGHLPRNFDQVQTPWNDNSLWSFTKAKWQAVEPLVQALSEAARVVTIVGPIALADVKRLGEAIHGVKTARITPVHQMALVSDGWPQHLKRIDWRRCMEVEGVQPGRRLLGRIL